VRYHHATVADWFTFAASAAAVVVAVIALAFSARAASQQNALQERLLALENAREDDRLRLARSAEVRAIVNRGAVSEREARLLGKTPPCMLVVRNHGAVPARNLELLLDGAPVLSHSLILRGEDDVNMLGPGADFSYVLAVDQGAPRVLNVTIYWDDDAAQRRRWDSQLKI
jgi:hypothetical protein